MKNNSDVKVMLKEAGILFAITLIAGLLLGFVYDITKEPIRLQKEKTVQEACAKVFADAAAFEVFETVLEEETVMQLAQNGVEIGTIYQAKSADGNLLGYVLQTTSKEGYGGKIVLYMGVRLDGTLNDISILEISETPGLGMEAEKVLVPQFHNVQTDSFTYTKNGSMSDSEVDAISGATITTKAVVNAVNGGLEVAAGLIQGGDGNE